MVLTLMLTATTAIDGYAPTASVRLEIPAQATGDEQQALLQPALATAWAELKDGVRADVAALMVPV